MEDNQDADKSPQTETTITKSSPRIGRLIVRIFLLVVIPVIAVVYGAQWYEKTGRFIETENAYVKTNVIAISADIDGRVTEVFVDENQIISKGDLLFKLDPTPIISRHQKEIYGGFDAMRDYNQIVETLNRN